MLSPKNNLYCFHCPKSLKIVCLYLKTFFFFVKLCFRISRKSWRNVSSLLKVVGVSWTVLKLYYYDMVVTLLTHYQYIRDNSSRFSSTILTWKLELYNNSFCIYYVYSVAPGSWSTGAQYYLEKIYTIYTKTNI